MLLYKLHDTKKFVNVKNLHADWLRLQKRSATETYTFRAFFGIQFMKAIFI